MIEHVGWLKTLNGFFKAIVDRVATAITRRKPKVHVHPVVGNEIWCIANSGNVEYMHIVCWAHVTHDDSKQAVIIMGVYPEGTTPQVDTVSHEVIPPGTMVKTQLSAIVAPILGIKGKPWKGRLILVDQFHRKHKTQKIVFKWVGGPPPTPAKE
jgi:hypothetical protein